MPNRIFQRAAALGYNEKEAATAMKVLPADIGTSDGIRQALKLLSKV
jgi:Holliday junction DNA helicase RuvA